MRIKKGFDLRRIGDENIVIATGADHVDFSNIISLNESAARLWKAVEGREFTTEELSSLLCEWYDVDTDMAKEDAEELVKRWQETGLTE